MSSQHLQSDEQQYATSFSKLAPTYLATSTIAIALSMLSLGMSHRYPQLRRHPSSIIWWNLVCDLLFALKFFVTSTAFYVRPHDRDYMYNESFHLIKDGCTSAAIYGTVFGVASTAWNFIWVLNFYFEVRSPFKSTKSYMPFYHFYVWTVTAIGLVLLVSLNQYSVSGDLTCWVKISSPVAWYADGLGILCGVFGVFTLCHLLYRLRGGLDLNRAHRSAIIRHHALYVGVFVFVWLPPLLWRHIDNIWGNGEPPLALRQSMAFFYCGQAVFICLVRFSEPQVRPLLFPCLFAQDSGGGGGGYQPGDVSDSASVLSEKSPLMSAYPPLRSGSRPGTAASGWGGASEAGSAVPMPMPGSRAGGQTSSGGASASASAAAAAPAWGVGGHLRDELVMCLLSGLCQNVCDNRALKFETVELEALMAVADSAQRVRFAFAMRDLATPSPLDAQLDEELGAYDDGGTPSSAADRRAMLASAVSDVDPSPPSTPTGTPAGSDTLRRRRQPRHFVTTYAADAFELIRLRYGIAALDIANTLSPDLFARQVISAKFSDAKSGSFFCFSSDREIIVKTMTADEVRVLLDVLPQYILHLRAYPDTLICPVFGCFTVEPMNTGKIHIVLMGNVLGTHPFESVYDLKGSTVKRTAYTGAGPRPGILMDGDFARREKGIAVTRDFRIELIAQLQRDTALLQAHSLMDYSMLIGIGPCDDAAERLLLAGGADGEALTLRGLRSRPLLVSADGEEVFKFGLIDLLQRFNVKKKIERGLKQVKYGNRNVDISAVAPPAYADRLVAYMRSILDVTDEAPRRSAEEILRRRAVSR